MHELHAARRRAARKGEVYEFYSQPFTDHPGRGFKARVFDGDGASQIESIFHGNLFSGVSLLRGPGSEFDHLIQFGLPENVPDFLNRSRHKRSEAVVGPHFVKLLHNHGSAGLGQEFDGHGKPTGNVPSPRG